MDLVVVEVLQFQSGILEHRGYRVRRRHQQAFLPGGEINCPRLSVAQVREHRKPLLRGPFVGGEQNRARPVGQRGAVSCGDRALGIKTRAQLRELLRSGVGADVVILVESERAGDQVAEKAVAPGRGGFHVALVRQPVLVLARDVPSFGHQLRALPHRQARARLDDGRQYRLEVAWPQPKERSEALPERAAAITLE